MSNTLWRSLSRRTRVLAVVASGLWGLLLVVGGTYWNAPVLVLAGICLTSLAVFVIVRTRGMNPNLPVNEQAVLAAVSGVETAGLALVGATLLTVAICVAVVVAVAWIICLVLAMPEG